MILDLRSLCLSFPISKMGISLTYLTGVSLITFAMGFESLKWYMMGELKGQVG